MSTRILDRLADVTRPTGEEDTLDITFPEHSPRFTVSPKTALIAAAAVAAVVAVIVARTLFFTAPGADDPPPFPAVADAEGGGSLTPGSEGNGSAAPGSAGTGEIVVSVVGAVHEPGLVTLQAGDRIADAIGAAGGLVDGADPAAINQAQLVVDGQQIVVPAAGEPGPVPDGAGNGGDGSGKVSLNSADATQLTTLDGVGEATAAAIISHREETGGFTAVEQLLDVSGIGPAKFASLKDQVTL